MKLFTLYAPILTTQCPASSPLPPRATPLSGPLFTGGARREGGGQSLLPARLPGLEAWS